ncbi:hypothetical protein [Arthrobacter sp. UYCo732]|uniref:DUF7007 domain-containing protein n=1 Tax=Arthrobacter sp. UYCo732 TaxID=3156336 RepID=UPI003390B8F3
MTDNVSRQPKGIPVGGQFAATAHSEPELVLGLPEHDVHFDPDGTEWDWRDPEATILEAGSVNEVGIWIHTDTAAQGVFNYDIVDYRNNAVVGRGSAGTLHDAKEAAKDDRYKMAKYASRFSIHEGSRTPWGKADGVIHLAPGIATVFTPGHGGVKLSPARNKEVDPVWRSSNSWYEEDCEWAITAITHREAYSEEHQKYAHQSARRWYPDEYEAVVGKDPARYGVTDYQPIAPGESSIRDEKVFFAANADKVQRAFSASYSKDRPGMTEVVVSDVTSTGARTGEPRTVVMPNDEYNALGNFRTIPKDAAYETLKEN